MDQYRKLGFSRRRSSGAIVATVRAAALVAALAAFLPVLAQRPGGGGGGAGGAGGAPQGTWTPLTNACPENPETALLMTDGSVFVKSFDGDFNHMFKLTPGANGNYANGVWSRLADAPVGEIYGPCQVLKDGRIFIAGGEYLASGASDHNTCEVYDPVTNRWTQGPDGLYGDIGDTGNSIMADGRIFS